MAPLTMATLPLQSCRMGISFQDRLGWRRQPVDGDGARLRTAVKAYAASGAVFAGVAGRVDAIGVQFRPQLQALGRAGLHAQPAAFTFIDANPNITSRWSCHCVTSLWPWWSDAATTWSVRNTRTTLRGISDAKSRSAPWPARGSTCRAGTRRRIPSRHNAP